MRTQQHIEGHAACGQRGFTVIEILVAIAIASILAAVAVPSLSGFLRNVKLNSISGSLVASLQQARGEAIARNQRVLVCPSNPARTDCAATADWGVNGWLLCYDGNADGVCDASTADAPNPIRVEEKVDTTFAAVTGPAAAIRFGPSGSQGDTFDHRHLERRDRGYRDRCRLRADKRRQGLGEAIVDHAHHDHA
ncbi:MAG: GspH/FimT family pseudopilin [Rhodanobacter sp.]